MPTIEELSTLDPNLLAAALEAARKREVNERLANLPKCHCGATATQVVKPVIQYKRADIVVSADGSARISRWEDWDASCPSYGEDPDDSTVWVCCEHTGCVDADWRGVNHGDLTRVYGF
jgi:hypothetical protein